MSQSIRAFAAIAAGPEITIDPAESFSLQPSCVKRPPASSPSMPAFNEKARTPRRSIANAGDRRMQDYGRDGPAQRFGRVVVIGWPMHTPRRGASTRNIGNHTARRNPTAGKSHGDLVPPAGNNPVIGAIDRMPGCRIGQHRDHVLAGFDIDDPHTAVIGRKVFVTKRQQRQQHRPEIPPPPHPIKTYASPGGCSL